MKSVSKCTLLLLTASMLTACNTNEPFNQVELHQIGLLQPIGDTSRNSLNWAGTYEATLPCASCAGIKTLLTLNSDGSYQQSRVYQSEEDGKFTEKGTFKWDGSGSYITLSNGDSYKVGENQLFMRDLNGNRLTGQLENHYRLIKNN
ncbi:copper resistance protein NlpE [Shewanella submarina]|uniref:Copper resistance protein NlpE n=1 Tax=Shewanella submarina TaxID=2016376 RepID=A0ABV7GJM8_9GAMM|nr:copper resistance protein NlpE [Shewanella submarina]MCL1036551.1 copper resistance protein NlpE [Shewanella submarina]